MRDPGSTDLAGAAYYARDDGGCYGGPTRAEAERDAREPISGPCQCPLCGWGGEDSLTSADPGLMAVERHHDGTAWLVDVFECWGCGENLSPYSVAVR
jgi:hypothetical protein